VGEVKFGKDQSQAEFGLRPKLLSWVKTKV